MFLPFEIGELHGIIEIIYRVVDLGWNPANNAQQQYVEFKQDVEALGDQLETLQLNIRISRARFGAQLAPTGQLQQIFDDFRETLEDCHRFLQSRAHYGTRPGVLSNVNWSLVAKDIVNMHRDRIAVLNLKLSLALQSLEIASRDGQSILAIELTGLVFQRLEQLHADVLRALGESAPANPPPRLDVPQPLAALFEAATVSRHGSPTTIPMCDGIDEAIFYLDRATRWHARRSRSPNPRSTASAPRKRERDAERDRRAFRLANVMRAYWLLQATRASDEYRAAAAAVSVAAFERQFPLLGMTAGRFFERLEERIVEAHAELIRSREVLPSVQQLVEAVEMDGDAWQEHREWEPREEEDDNSRRGNRVAVCYLRNTGTAPGRTLEVWSREPEDGCLTVITSCVSRADEVHHVDLQNVSLVPEAAHGSSGVYSVFFSPVKGYRPGPLRLAFQGEEDLFGFQQWMTGYKVVDDFPGAVVTLQRANFAIGGERRSNAGRIQIWSSTRASPGRQLPEELLDSEPSKRRNIKSRIVAPYAPMLAPIAAFSRLSLSLGPTRDSSTTDLLEKQAAPSTPSLTRTSTVTSRTSRSSSSSSVSGVSKRPTNLIQVDNLGNIGCILDQPDPPRLVVFLPSNGQQQGTRRAPPTVDAGSLLVIDINQHIRINPNLCSCHQDSDTPSADAHPIIGEATVDRNGILSLPPDLSAPSPTPPGYHQRQRPQSMTPPARQPASSSTEEQRQQQQREQQGCRKVVLEAAHASGITARESAVAAEGGRPVWNLASAGRHQDGEGLGRVKRLKKVVVGFGCVEERVRFVEYFISLRELYLIRSAETLG